MEADEFLIPDKRWEIWKCFTHQEYLDRFFIPGRFHKDVPEKVCEAYLTVERLISFSYFYYPLTEEVHSKITRVFEIAVRLRAAQLNLNIKKKQPTLNDIIDEFKKCTEFDTELIEALQKVKKLRNSFAHPDGLMYWGPIGYSNVIAIINIINRLFISVNKFHEYVSSGQDLAKKVDPLLPGLAVLQDGDKKYLVFRAIPLMVNPSKAKSVWFIVPVLIKFPQTMEEYKEYKPFVLYMTQLQIGETGVDGYSLDRGSSIKIYQTINKTDIDVYNKYRESYATSDDEVKRMHESMVNQTFFDVVDRFLYEEFWNC